jgi:hypothetical protein
VRAALNQALLAADPEAAERRRQAEEHHARVERGPEPGGVTALLAGRCLPVTATVTAWNRITGLARQLRAAGAVGSLDELRVHVYLALLNGQPVTVPAADAILTSDEEDSTVLADGEEQPCSGPDDPAALEASADCRAEPAHGSAGVQGPGLWGQVNLTVPLSTVLGLSNGPGQLAGFGAITGHTARQFAESTLGQPAVRWCITVLGDQGEALGHGCATRIRPASAPPDDGGPPVGGGPLGNSASPGSGGTAAPGDPGWMYTVKLTALAGSECAHTRESGHYRPPPSLWHLVQTRNVCCAAPGCRMAASVCDDDHTVPFGQGGRTCECNLGPPRVR